MRPRDPVDPLEIEYLRAVRELAAGKAKSAVPFREVQDHLGWSADDVIRCSDACTSSGLLEWPVLGHVALTHRGLAVAARDHARSVPVAAAGSLSERVVSVVIPSHDEADTIAALVKSALKDPRVLEVIVVDDGSVDGTLDIAEAAGATVMTSSFLGRGASMRDGLMVSGGEVVVLVDGGLSSLGEEVSGRLAGPILSGDADVVKAGFSCDEDRAMVIASKPLLSSFFPELDAFSQPLGGVVAARRAVLAGIELESDFGVGVGLLIDAAMKGGRLVEIGIGTVDRRASATEIMEETAKAVTRVILDRAWKYGRLRINQVRELHEADWGALQALVPLAAGGDREGAFALLGMEGVLLEGRFALEMGSRMGVLRDLTPFLDNRAISEADRIRLVASAFVGGYRDSFEDAARSMPLVEGAVETVVGLRRAGCRVGIVSDSFTVAAETVRRRVFADFSIAHTLRFRNGVCTGEVTLAGAMVESRYCDLHECCKANVLEHLRREAGLVPEETLAVGDGENDICLLRRAGVSVAFRPRSPLVADAAGRVVTGALPEILAALPVLLPSPVETIH